jgi:hypothetical protein
MSKFGIFTLFLMLGLCAFAQAQNNEPMVSVYGGSGMTLLHQCEAAVKLSGSGHSTYNGQAGDAADASYCNGYVNGIVDQLTIMSSAMKTAYCLPSYGGSNEQFVRIVLKYLQDHPESLNQPAISPTSLAITGAFPCGK